MIKIHHNRALINHYAGTGEHGVGVGKKAYLIDELGPNTVQLMKKIKHTLDPLNLFNPGKVSELQMSFTRALCSQHRSSTLTSPPCARKTAYMPCFPTDRYDFSVE